ncbi:butyrate kinase [bacterium]|nr:MAG: butyrate kinase [bacterium]
MFDIEKALDDQLFEHMENRPTVVFTEAHDPRIIEAACYLARFIRPVFLASENSVRDNITENLQHIDSARVEFTLSESTFIDIEENDGLLEELANAYIELPEEFGFARKLDEAVEKLLDPALFGIMAVREGHADTVVGGVTHEPIQFFRPMLKLLAVDKIIGETGIFVLPDEHPADIYPHNIVVFGDVGVNATMTPEILAHIAVCTCSVARDIFPEDILPVINGAIVSHSNRGSDEGPSPELVRKAAALVPGVLAKRIKLGERYKSIHIEGEVKVNVALSRRSAAYYMKREERDWAGLVNVIICPNLDLGNLLYHLYATRYPEAKKFPVLCGLRFKGIDLPMDCTPEDAILAVKANTLRMHRFGEWRRTPKDTFFKRYRILAINPGSTSTKISVYEGDIEAFSEELKHEPEELAPFKGKSIMEQYSFRKEVVLKALLNHGLSVDDLDAVSARGGLLRPIPHGTYKVNDAMCKDLLRGFGGEHASNLGGLIAREIVGDSGKPSFIVDPVVVDEVPIRAKITGFKEIRRKVISHALNQIATARRYAEENETFYEYLNLIVAHMGGGITIGAHHKGRYLDVNDGLTGEGPFTPERSGSLPPGQLIDLCFSGKYTHKQLKQLNKGQGGLIDLLGTSDLREVEKRIENGDEEAAMVFEAMAYQISKNIAALIPAFDGEPVDRILLTGGMARSKRLVETIENSVAAIGCGVTVFPGENEMLALAKGALRVLQGKENAKTYDFEEREATLDHNNRGL